MLFCDWVWLILSTKILAIVPEFSREETKEFKSVLMLEKQPPNCVYTSITGESVMVSSTQVLFAEKYIGMKAGSVISEKAEARL